MLVGELWMTVTVRVRKKKKLNGKKARLCK